MNRYRRIFGNDAERRREFRARLESIIETARQTHDASLRNLQDARGLINGRTLLLWERAAMSLRMTALRSADPVLRAQIEKLESDLSEALRSEI